MVWEEGGRGWRAHGVDRPQSKYGYYHTYLEVQVVEDGGSARPRPDIALRGDRAEDESAEGMCAGNVYGQVPFPQ